MSPRPSEPAKPEEPRRPLPPWAYQESTPVDLWSLPRPGDPDWQDPINPYDLGPLSDEREGGAK